ncbi:MAG: hypothetical protein WCB46_08345 [Methanoregula sp.]
MPRRPDIVTEKIPLFLILPVIKKELKNAGEELQRIMVTKSNRHFYNISVRTRSINRELRSEVPRANYRKSSGVPG